MARLNNIPYLKNSLREIKNCFQTKRFDARTAIKAVYLLLKVDETVEYTTAIANYLYN